MASTSTHSKPINYATAGRDILLARIAELESSIASTSTIHEQEADATKSSKALRRRAKHAQKTNGVIRSGISPAKEQDANAFFDRYPSRKIALRFCYKGWLYSGLAVQNEDTPLPTVEGILLDALVEARLIRTKEDLESIEFSRCGRTDKGVSAAGQVVSLYVRSQLLEVEGRQEPSWRCAKVPKMIEEEERQEGQLQSEEILNSNLRQSGKQKHKLRDELPYMRLLNRYLPSSIRILAWSPVKADFDSRFLCTFRHYKYFFSTSSCSISSSYSSSPAPSSNILDIQAMRNAASRLVGEHDFRNFCKVDPTKQITNFRRRIISATIDQLSSGPEERDQMYLLNLKGTAFLYHQVRHIMAILFLVGSRVEAPSIVDALFNTGYRDSELDSNITWPDPETPVVASRPSYEMADDLPLVLWECGFPEGVLEWRQDSSKDGGWDNAPPELFTEWERDRLRSTISRHFIDSYISTKTWDPASSPCSPQKECQGLQIGAGRTLHVGHYVPLLERNRGNLVEVTNQRWLEGQGKRRALRKAEQLDTASETEQLKTGE